MTGVSLALFFTLLIRQGKKDRYIPCTVNKERNSGKLVHSYRHRSLLAPYHLPGRHEAYSLDWGKERVVPSPNLYALTIRQGKSCCLSHPAPGTCSVCKRELEAEGPRQQYHLRARMDHTLGGNEGESIWWIERKCSYLEGGKRVEPR